MTPNLYEPVAEICRLLNLKPGNVRRLDITPKSVTAEVLRLNEHGYKYVDPETDAPAVDVRTFDAVVVGPLA